MKIKVRYSYCSWLIDSYAVYGEFKIQNKTKGITATSNRSSEDAKNKLIGYIKKAIRQFRERDISKDMDVPDNETIEIEVPGLGSEQ